MAEFLQLFPNALEGNSSLVWIAKSGQAEIAFAAGTKTTTRRTDDFACGKQAVKEVKIL